MRHREPGETEPDAYDHLESRAAHAALEAFAKVFVEGAKVESLSDALTKLSGSRHEHLAMLCLEGREPFAVRMIVHFDSSPVAVESLLDKARARGDIS